MIDIILRHAGDTKFDARFLRHATALFREAIAADDDYRDVAAHMRMLRRTL